DSADLKEAILNAESICFRKSSMAKIRLSNMKNHKRRRRLKYYCRQTAAMIFGLFYDLTVKIKGETYEVIRVRKESQ
ncbi:MAG: hypothetical protein GX847_02140, partial [Clostridiales bacterium]|nr:hypothetical protein [Clostridiales bacterium]